MSNQKYRSRGSSLTTGFQMKLQLKSNYSTKYKHLRDDLINLSSDQNYLNNYDRDKTIENEKKANIIQIQKQMIKQNPSPRNQEIICQGIDKSTLNIKNRFEQIKKKYDNEKIQIKTDNYVTNINLDNVLTEINKPNNIIPSKINTINYQEQRKNIHQRRSNDNQKCNLTFDQNGSQLNVQKQTPNFNSLNIKNQIYQKSSINNYINNTINLKNAIEHINQSQQTINNPSKQENKKYSTQSKPIQNSSDDKFGIRSEKIDTINNINQRIENIMNCIKNDSTKKNQNRTPETNQAFYQSLTKRQSLSNLDKKYQDINSIMPNKPQNKQLLKSAKVNNIEKSYRIYQPEIKVSEFNWLDDRNTNSIQKRQFENREKNGIKLEEQIKHIQQKIKISEQEKKKLNMKFQGYLKQKSNNFQNKVSEDIQNIVIKTNSPKKQIKVNRINYTKQPQNNNYTQQKKQNWKTPDKVSKPQLEQSLLVQNKNFVAEKNIKKEVTHCNQIKKNLRPRAVSDIKSPKRINQIQINSIKKIKEFDERIQIYNIKNQSNTVIESFRAQITLDEKLRQYKLLFSNNQDPQKWKKLESEIIKYKTNWDQTKIINQFNITVQQYDPFYSVQDTCQSVQALVKIYLNADQYWQKNIRNHFTLEILKNEGITEQLMDRERKGYLIIQDFVRLINLRTEATFFRNRDLILFYRRLIDNSENNKLNFKVFVSKITRH